MIEIKFKVTKKGMVKVIISTMFGDDVMLTIPASEAVKLQWSKEAKAALLEQLIKKGYAKEALALQGKNKNQGEE